MIPNHVYNEDASMWLDQTMLLMREANSDINRILRSQMIKVKTSAPALLLRCRISAARKVCCHLPSPHVLHLFYHLQ